jgi:hypothetical protein
VPQWRDAHPGQLHLLSWFPQAYPLAVSDTLVFDHSSNALVIDAQCFDVIQNLTSWNLDHNIVGWQKALTAGTPEELKTAMKGLDKEFDTLCAFNERCRDMVYSLKEYPTGQELDEVLWRACIFDVVEGVSPAPPKYRQLLYDWFAYNDLVRRLRPYAPEYDVNEARLDRRFSLLVWSLQLSIPAAVAIQLSSMGGMPKTWTQWFIALLLLFGFEACFVQFLSRLPWQYVFKKDFHRLKKLAYQSHRFEEVRKHHYGSFGTTEKGYVGWFSKGTKVGDTLCFVPYLDIPLVLRRNAVGDGYILIGDSYVHGLMMGSRIGIENVSWTRVRIT